MKVGASGKQMGLDGIVALFIEQILCGRLHAKHFACLICNPAKAVK